MKKSDSINIFLEHRGKIIRAESVKRFQSYIEKKAAYWNKLYAFKYHTNYRVYIIKDGKEITVQGCFNVKSKMN